MKRMSLLAAVVLALSSSLVRAETVKECVAEGNKMHKETMALHAKAVKAHELNPKEKTEFADMEKRLKAVEVKLGKDGISLADCKEINADIAKEKTALEKMMVVPTGVKACQAANQKEHAEIVKLHAEAMKKHELTPAEQKEFADMEKRLKTHAAALAKNGLTPKECGEITKELIAERKKLEEMSANLDKKGPLIKKLP